MVQVIDFWSETCGPCMRIMPLIDRVSREYEGKVNITKHNINQNPELVKQFKITGVPTFVYMKDDVEVDRTVGIYPINLMREKLNSLL
jgi:thioredoxin 1